MKPINQTFLALIIALLMLSGFAGVYVVAWNFEQTRNVEILFESDSDVEFQEVNLDALFLDRGYTPPGIMHPQFYYRLAQTSVFHQINMTMVYVGNNTWDAAVPCIDPPVGETFPTRNALVYVPVDLAFLKSVLVSSITLKMNLPGDADIEVEHYIASSPNPWVSDTQGTHAVIQDVTTYDGETTYDETFVINSVDALKIYAGANDPLNDITYWAIEIYDVDGDGMTPYNINMEFSFSGTYVSTWTLQDTVNLVIGMSIIGNVIAGVYMTDGVDFGEVRKDLGRKLKGGK